MMLTDFPALMCRLRPHYESAAEARSVLLLLLEERWGLRPAAVLAGGLERLTAEQQAQLEADLRALEAGRPVQYVLGVAEAGGRRWRVTPDVLVPRPETSELTAWVVADGAGRSPLRLLDAGTGSGFIAVSLALDLPGAEVVAWDVSAPALAVARSNAERLGARVRFEQHDMRRLPADLRRYDMIVSNPPYVRCSERADMERRVCCFEPELALFVSDADPLEFYRALAELGQARLQPGGALYVEINAALANETTDLLRRAGYGPVACRPDAYGRPRMVRAIWPGQSS